MASTSEVGHAKNVAHLTTLITYCTSYGTSYNPSNPAIKLPALNTLAANAQTAITNVINDATANTSAINARIIAFLNIKKLATRMFSALGASGATAQQKANAKTINRKIQGSRAKLIPTPLPAGGAGGGSSNPASGTTPASAEKTTTPPSTNPVPTPTPVAPHTISTAQLSFDQLIQHMAAFIALLQSVPTYNPNEVDLKIAALNTYLANLNATNNAAVVAHTKVNNTRIARNKILYTPVTGLCDIGDEVKDYIKSVYGATAPEYRQIRSLKFKGQKL
jgi:hypothetical protein